MIEKKKKKENKLNRILKKIAINNYISLINLTKYIKKAIIAHVIHKIKINQDIS